MKKILLLSIVMLVALSGCIENKETSHVYFDMPCDVDSCNQCSLQEKCKEMCNSSGARILGNTHKSKVEWFDGNYVCDCY